MAEFTNNHLLSAELATEEASTIKPQSEMQHEDEDCETEEDRIEWLRQRGVLIDIPNERKSSKNKGPKQLIEVNVVRIPHNELLPYEDVCVSVDLSQPGDQLVSALAHFFGSSASSIDRDMLRETAKKQFGTNGDVNISEATLDALAAKGSVEVFPLSHACEANRFSGVSFYLDEASVLKSLPFNPRASAIAAMCGFKGVNLCGDMFIGRTKVYPSGGGIKNESIFVNEIDSSQEWIRVAERNNYQVGLANNRVVMDGQTSSALEEEEALKEKEGNGYKWSQTDSTVDVSLELPEGQGAKTIAVKFTRSGLTVTNKANPSTVYLSLVDLFGAIASSECTWSCSSKAGVCTLEMSMEKASEGYWKALVK